MISKYLIRCYEPEDWVRHVDEGTQDVNDFILPLGPRERNEMSDTIYHAGTDVPYHEHSRGTETFFIARGCLDATIRGKRFRVNTGDILHIPPYTPHGFVFLEEGTVWRELFQDINMQQGILNKNMVKSHYPELYDDPEFMAVYREANGSFPRETPVVEDVDGSTMHELRTPEFSFNTFHFDGCEMRLKVGRWECDGVKEVWQLLLDKGVTVEFDDPHPYFELYYIWKGSVKFKVLDEEFVAEANSIVHIPPYAKHSFEVLEDGTEMFDNGCETRMLSLLEDWNSIQKNDPKRLEDPAARKKFLHKYKCFVTNYYKK